jgi:hypothetical protein
LTKEPSARLAADDVVLGLAAHDVVLELADDIACSRLATSSTVMC